MNIARARREIFESEMKELTEKRDRFYDRDPVHLKDSFDSPSPNRDNNTILKDPTDNGVNDIGSGHDNDTDKPNFNAEELPDGFCISPSRNFYSHQDTQDSAIRPAEYIGSFQVIGEEQLERTQFVKTKLTEMRDTNKCKAVLLVFSLTGIKVCSSGGESVYMAHALKRISYATCDPEFCQFSILAREAKIQSAKQYCHTFITKTPEEADELNNIIGNAFQMAYAQERQQEEENVNKVPSFNELIQKQIEEQKQLFQEYSDKKQKQLDSKLKVISTPTVSERAHERKALKLQRLDDEEKVRLSGKDRKSWAKQVAGRSRHKLPHQLAAERSQSEQCIMSSSIAPLASPFQGSDGINAASRSSFESIKEVLNSQDLSHGSPVMALKETIDRHYKYSSSKLSPSDMSYLDDCSTKSYLYGLSSPHEDGDDLDSPVLEHVNDIQNKQLQNTPTLYQDRQIKKFKSKSSVDTRKSGIFVGSPSLARITNGNVRPVSYHGNGSPADSDDPVGLYYGGTMMSTIPRYDSLRKLDSNGKLIEDESLRQAAWYQTGIPREIALEVLVQQEIGSFVIRDSTTHSGCYALSVKVPKFENPAGISHYLIQHTSKGGYKLKGLEKEWPNLMALVTHHTVMPEMLPCTLRLPRNANNPSFKNKEEKDDKDEDEDYQKLSDFTSMMDDLSL